MKRMDDEFKYFLSNMSCLSVLQNPYADRCALIGIVSDCDRIVNAFNYFEVMYCFFRIKDKTTEIIVMFVFILIVLFYILTISVVVYLFCSPVLKILSVKMHMNEYLAGVTLLPIGNTIPDLIGNMLPVRDQSAIVACSACSALTIMLLCGGMVCYLKPFRVDGYSIFRDLLFLLLTANWLFYIVLFGSHVTTFECWVLILLFFVYVIVNVIDLLLVRSGMKRLRKKIEKLRAASVSEDRNRELESRLQQLEILEEHVEMNIHRHNANYYIPDGRYSNIEPPYKKRLQPQGVDYVATREHLHNKKNSKNRYIFSDFIQSINPFNVYDWVTSSKWGRVVIVIRSPMTLIAILFVPMVNYENSKHGWSKLLNCLQIINNPFIIITVIDSVYRSEFVSWHPVLSYHYSKWSFCASVPLAIIVFLHSRTDVPPSYHFAFILLNVVSSLFLITICCAEVQVLTSIVGIVFNLSGDFMDITFGSLISAFLDLLTTYTATMQGYEKMAFASIIASSIYSLSGCGLAMLLNEKIKQNDSTWLIGEHGENGHVFIVLSIAVTFAWCLTFNFNARRSIAILYWMLFLIFITYASLIEFDFIHSFTSDRMLHIE